MNIGSYCYLMVLPVLFWAALFIINGQYLDYGLLDYLLALI